MSYVFYGVITFNEALELAKGKYQQLRAVQLRDNVVAIPLSNELYDEINLNQSVGIKKYDYLTEAIGSFCAELSGVCKVAYIEAEYFGGDGYQNGIVWDSGEVVFEQTLDGQAINGALRSLGLMRNEDHDEFDTVGLGRQRSVERWIKHEVHL